MTTEYADRVKETSTTTGTGTLNLDGAVDGFQTFVAGIATTNQCYYMIVADNGDWEVGLGTVTDGSPDTLSRTTVLDSSNGGAAVSFAAGTKTVLCTAPALVYPTPWRAFDNGGSWVANTNYNGFWRRSGPDTIDVHMEIDLTGAPTSANLTINLPSGLTLDTAKFGTQTEISWGHVLIRDAAPSVWLGVATIVDTSTGVILVNYYNVSGSQVTRTAVTQAAPFTFATGDFIEVVVQGLPVTGL